MLKKKKATKPHSEAVFVAFLVAGAVGLEPTTRGFGDRCATNCAIPLSVLVGHQGLEPGTDRL